jgi:hypothetical protein
LDDQSDGHIATIMLPAACGNLYVPNSWCNVLTYFYGSILSLSC